MRDHDAFWLFDQGVARRTAVKHGRTSIRVDDEPADEPGLYVIKCDCGWQSDKPKSQWLIHEDYEAHLKEAG